MLAIPGDTVARREDSGFQILAQFAQHTVAGMATDIGGCAAELATEGLGKMAVAGKAQFEGQRGEVVRAIGQPMERISKA